MLGTPFWGKSSDLFWPANLFATEYGNQVMRVSQDAGPLVGRLFKGHKGNTTCLYPYVEKHPFANPLAFASLRCAEDISTPWCWIQPLGVLGMFGYISYRYPFGAKEPPRLRAPYVLEMFKPLGRKVRANRFSCPARLANLFSACPVAGQNRFGGRTNESHDVAWRFRAIPFDLTFYFSEGLDYATNGLTSGIIKSLRGSRKFSSWNDCNK